MTAPRDPQNSLGKDQKAAQPSKASLLKKRIVDLTESEIAEIEVLLGTPELPFPMWGTLKTEHEGASQLGQALTAIAEDENPLVVLSERPFEQAWGIIARELPTPSMLPIFREMLERLEPESKNRQFFVMGDPGMGKSFMGGMIARVMSTDSPRVYDCGGKQMNSMLFEMVLDFGAGDGMAALVEKRMTEGKLSQASVLELRKLAQTVNKDDASFINELSNGVFEIDWNAIGKGSVIGNEKTDAVFKAFSQISAYEGFDKGGANMLGMNSQFGPMVTDFIEGNFSVYDEYNKSKEGGDDALQTVLQFINGEIDECTVENPLKGKDGVSGPTHFTFQRADVKAGWGILFTGNKSKDGKTTRSLNKSVYSRLGPKDLPEVSEADWAHRIGQLMTGVPVSTWYNAYKDEADKNPQAFADFLWTIRTAGLSGDEVKAIPAAQKVWLQNWERIVSASEKLGTFFHGWRERLDEDLASLKFELEDEIDADFGAEQALDFRRVIKVLQKAAKPRAQLKPTTFKPKLPGKDALKKPQRRVARDRKNENLEASYGTRLMEILINDIYESSGAIGKPRLYESLMELAKECSLVELELKEAARSKVRTVEDELNISRFDSADIRVQAQIAQEMFCKMLREKFPEIQAGDNEIVTVERMAEIIADMREKVEVARETNLLTVPSRNMEQLVDKPFVDAGMIDTLSLDDSETPYFDDILTLEEFLEAFVLPGVQEKNLNAVWDSNLSVIMKLEGIQESVKKAESDMVDADDRLKTLKNAVQKLKDELKTLKDSGSDDSKRIKALTDDIAKSERDQTEVKENIENLKVYKAEKQEILDRVKTEGAAVLKDVADESDFGMISADNAMHVAENRSKTGIAFTTVACRIEDKDDNPPEDAPFRYSLVHIFRNTAADKTVIVADKISDSLRSAFNQAKIKYIDLSEENAANTINAAISDIIKGTDSEATLKLLSGAFDLRNPQENAWDADIDLGSKVITQKEILQRPGDEEQPQIKYFYRKPAAA